MKHVLEGLATVIASAGVRSDQILGLGVAVAGVVEGNAVVDAQTLGWDAVPLGADAC